MTERCTVQLHQGAQWHDVATVTLRDDPASGWRARARVGYLTHWAIDHAEARDAHALSCQLPVSLDDHVVPHWPVCLIDALPQGYGRREMLRQMGLAESAGPVADWRLLLAGAGNPVGNLRIREAAEQLEARDSSSRGFHIEEIASRGEAFSEHLADHGLFVGGSSGLQGEWPKLQLTRGDDGLFHLDHLLPDSQARAHYIVKFARGSDERMAAILRHEAVYMQIAQRLGLRVHAPLTLSQRALFVPRFDRQPMPDGSVLRLGQETLAAFVNEPGFSPAPSHDEACRHILLRCTDPQRELLEYLRRDVANLALGNKDNHGRNTAILRDFSGRVALSPLFDFAPMVLHPDGIARCMRWQGNDGGRPNWSRVLDRVCDLDHDLNGATRAQPLDRAALARGLATMAPLLREIAANAQGLGIEPELLGLIKPQIEATAASLEPLGKSG
jgi:serine/threonine-protein kinase HipA